MNPDVGHNDFDIMGPPSYLARTLHSFVMFDCALVILEYALCYVCYIRFFSLSFREELNWRLSLPRPQNGRKQFSGGRLASIRVLPSDPQIVYSTDCEIEHFKYNLLHRLYNQYMMFFYAL